MKPLSRFARVTAEKCGRNVAPRCRAGGRLARLAATRPVPVPVPHARSRAQRILADASALLTRARASAADAALSAAPQQRRGDDAMRIANARGGGAEVKVAIARFGDPVHDAATLADHDPLTGIFVAILSELEASGDLLPEDLIAAAERPAVAGKAFPTH
jgi:hypothetical protein